MTAPGMSIHPTDWGLRVRRRDGVVFDLRGHRTGEVIVHPSYNETDTDEDRCAEFRRLDAKWDESPLSPLHHDNRCPVHGAPHHRRQP